MKRLIQPLIVFFAMISFISSAKDTDVSFRDNGVYFIENKGQVTDQYGQIRNDIQYALHAPGMDVFIGNGQLHYQFSQTVVSPDATSFLLKKEDEVQQVNTYRLDVSLEGADPHSFVIAEEKQSQYFNYKTPGAASVTRANAFKSITYKNVYPGIDWKIYIHENELEYDFIVSEGANPKNIKLLYGGSTAMRINAKGEMEIETPYGSITEHAPVAFASGKEVNCNFQLNSNLVSFYVDGYHGKLIIDPTIAWATYYGGMGNDTPYGMGVDDAGNIYLTGHTTSATNIATVGSYQQTFSGGSDFFVAKFNSAGQCIWATYYGGTGNENILDAECDHSQNIYACGHSSSTGLGTTGVHQPQLNGVDDACLMKFDSTGSLVFFTYYGGFNYENGFGLTVDINNNVYMCGSTSSDTCIATAGTYQDSVWGINEAFLVKFDSMGVRQWGSYFGGTATENGYDVATDSAGAVYLCGETQSTTNIATNGSFQPLYQGGGRDGFLAKFNGSNGQLTWGTYCGDLGDDAAHAVICGSLNEVYVSGYTDGITNLHTNNGYQVVNHGFGDVFIEKFDSGGTRIWGTYYGGTDGDDVNEMITDDNGNIWICSITWSPDYIATSDATQLNIGGITDGYLAQFSPNCELLWASYFGGMASERAMDIESYGSSIYICGTTSSASSIATQNAHQTVIGGGSWDCFLARFNICPNPIVTASGATSFCAGDSVILTVPSSLSYQWMLNGNVIAGATDSFYVALASGNYSVAVNNSACGADTSAQMPVTVNPLPVPVITNVGTTLNTGSFSSYQWNLNGNPISGATSQSYSASQGGPYTVTVTDGNGCVGTSAPISLSVTSVQNNSEGLLVYPNPNNGTFTVKAILQSREKEALLTITDIAGRNLASQNVAIKNGVINSEINTGNDLAPGIYLLKLSTGAKSSVISFVKK